VTDVSDRAGGTRSNGEERPAELPLASAEEEAEVERIQAKLADPPAGVEEFDAAAVEAETT
jgi:hypothetical protein